MFCVIEEGVLVKL